MTTSTSHVLTAVQRVPPAGTIIHYAIGQTAYDTWNISVFTLQTDDEGKPTGAPLPCVALTGDDPVLLAHNYAALVARFGWIHKASNQLPPGGTEMPGWDGKPTVVPSLRSLLVNDDGSTRPLAKFPEDRSRDAFLRQLWGILDATARSQAQMAVKASAGKLKQMSPEDQEAWGKTVPDLFKVVAPNGAVAAICGARMDEIEPMIGKPCVSGGPCALTKSGRCFRLAPQEALVADGVATPAPQLEAGAFQPLRTSLPIPDPPKPKARRKSPAKKTTAAKKPPAKKTAKPPAKKTTKATAPPSPPATPEA